VDLSHPWRHEIKIPMKISMYTIFCLPAMIIGSTRAVALVFSDNKGTVLTQIVAQGHYYFYPKNKDKTLQIVPQCDIIWGCTTIKFYTHMHTTSYILNKILPFYWQLMTTATILSVVFNFIIHGDHTYKAIWMLNMGGHSVLWVEDGDDHDTFVVVVIMTEYIVGHVLKAITYHHLLLKICTCGTIWGCTTIKLITKIRLFVLE